MGDRVRNRLVAGQALDRAGQDGQCDSDYRIAPTASLDCHELFLAAHVDGGLRVGVIGVAVVLHDHEHARGRLAAAGDGQLAANRPVREVLAVDVHVVVSWSSFDLGGERLISEAVLERAGVIRLGKAHAAAVPSRTNLRR